MDPILSAILSGLFCSLISGYVGFRLGRSGQATDRRRQFRSEIRVMAEEAGGSHAMYLWQAFERHAPVVRRLSIAITDDVPIWSRRRFQRLCSEYLSLTHDHLRPKDNPDESTQKKQWAKPRETMKELLEDIANAA